MVVARTHEVDEVSNTAPVEEGLEHASDRSRNITLCAMPAALKGWWPKYMEVNEVCNTA